MHTEKLQKYYSCGHPRPQGPIGAILAHAKLLLHPHAQLASARQTDPLPHGAALHNIPSPLHTVIFTNPFHDYAALLTSHRPSSPNSSHSNSVARVSSIEHELTHEERVAAGMEYMHAFLASRSKSPLASKSPANSTTPTPEAKMNRRVALSAA